MKKKFKSLACPFCNSSNIMAEMYRTNVKEKLIKNAYYEKTNDVVVKCLCKDCFKEYEVNEGIEKITRYIKPERETCCGDVSKLLSYETESPSFREFSLYETNNSYIIMEENDDLPVIISKEIKDDIIADPEVGKKLVYNTWLNRYR